MEGQEYSILPLVDYPRISVAAVVIHNPRRAMFRKTVLTVFPPLSRKFHSAKLIRDHNRFGIIGVPFAKGQRKCGVDLGPSAIRSGGLISNLKEIAGRLSTQPQILFL